MADSTHRERQIGEATGGDVCPSKREALDLASVRERLASARGPRYWRSLEELAGSPAFEELLHREFPRQASEWAEGLDRRRFLQLATASLALGGLAACTRQPLERIVPYVKAPEQIIPGRPLHFATATVLGGYAMGLIVESHEGRPTKIEGNPGHPASLGATDLFALASVLGLYDPDRSQVLTSLGTIQTWAVFVKEMQARAQAQKALKGAGIRILTETVTSPTLVGQIRALLAQYPRAKWHQWEPAGRDSARLGARLAFGEAAEVRYDFSKADVVVSLDADFLTTGPGAVRYARDFTARRRPRNGQEGMNRL
jgi:molybdopterin-containing oxidoreductase family iron-sulfur binding subunit